MDIFTGSIDERKDAVSKLLNMESNFDIIQRDITIGGRPSTLLAGNFLISRVKIPLYPSIIKQASPARTASLKLCSVSTGLVSANGRHLYLRYIRLAEVHVLI